MEILLLVPTAILGFLLWWEKRDRREERQEHKLERIGLLNRIQAPEIEIARTAPEPSGEPLYVPFGDDEAHEKYLEQRDNGEVF